MPVEENTGEDQQTEGTEEQSAQDQAGSDESGVSEQVDEESADSGDASEDSEVELLSKEQYESLKGDPEKLMKELNRAATKKFQQTSAMRKKLEPYANFIQAVEEDPVSAVTEVAKRLGIKLAES